MGNFVSVLSHCWGRGFEVLMGDQSHIHLDEQGGMAQVCVYVVSVSTQSVSPYQFRSHGAFLVTHNKEK